MSSASDAFAKSLRALQAKIDAAGNNSKFSDHWNWQALPLSKADLSYTACVLVEKVESSQWDESEDINRFLEDLTSKVDAATTNIVPSLFGGPQASDVLASFLSNLDIQIESKVSPGSVRGLTSSSRSIKKSVDAINVRISAASNSLGAIEEKIDAINAAYDAAEHLPITQQELDAAVRSISSTRDSVIGIEKEVSSKTEQINKALSRLAEIEKQGDAVLIRVHEAYRAATSQGLAQAFSEKAKKLNSSMLIWVTLLVVSLAAAGLLAHQKFPTILAALAGRVDWGLITINIIFGALSVAPPIWVAWVATKQIGQRFRLSEDYAYKAALSAAYEGYKKEAASLDPLFEAQLFATALGRLDELPLRLVEREVHGSPWHELLASKELKSAVDKFPELKERIASLLKRSAVGKASESPAEKHADEE